jgi:hypothetical protein
VRRADANAIAIVEILSNKSLPKPVLGKNCVNNAAIIGDSESQASDNNP